MKIVRVTLKVGGQSFYLDRPFDEKKDEQANCDEALKFISETVEKGTTLAVMLMGEGILRPPEKQDDKPWHDPFYNSQPSILRLSLIALVVIDAIQIYSMTSPEGAPDVDVPLTDVQKEETASEAWHQEVKAEVVNE